MTSNGVTFPFWVTSLFQLALSGRVWNPRRRPQEGDLYAMGATQFFSVSLWNIDNLPISNQQNIKKNTQSSLPSAPASPMFSWERLLCCSVTPFCFIYFVSVPLFWKEHIWRELAMDGGGFIQNLFARRWVLQSPRPAKQFRGSNTDLTSCCNYAPHLIQCIIEVPLQA